MLVGHQITRIRNSFEQVSWSGDKFATRFYENLFEIAPETRALFPEDMSVQSRKLYATLILVVKTLNDLPTLIPTLEELGRVHGAIGVTEDQYGIVAQALLATLEEVVPDWSDEDQNAWTALYTIAAGVMLKAGHAVAAEKKVANE